MSTEQTADKFSLYERVEHRNTRGRYTIVGTPSTGEVVEATGEPGYRYTLTGKFRDPAERKYFTRGRKEMEDGRFFTLDEQ